MHGTVTISTNAHWNSTRVDYLKIDISPCPSKVGAATSSSLAVPGLDLTISSCMSDTQMGFCFSV